MEIDLHLAPLSERAAPGLERSILEPTATVVYEGREMPTLDAAAHLLVVVVHGLRFNPAPTSRWLLDAGVLVESGRVDWTRFQRLAEAWSLGYALAAGLRVLASQSPSGLLPTGLLARLGHGPRVAERCEHYFRVRAPVGLLGTLPNLYFFHRRERRHVAPRRGFLGFLREFWGCGGHLDLVQLVFQKASRRVSRLFGLRARGVDPGPA